ncbi:MFS transporter [Pimelobacter simplex]|uniref:MFS transporter n=1 Tax=Nocardioides simplex TaxID=2045 RepID=UPI0019334A50|nr:MFS transporter [Pimelobacter simplex]
MVSISQDRGTAAAPIVRNKWPSLFVVCIGVMMTFINASSTIGALASIQDDLHVSGSTLVWVTSAFALALVSLVMSAGTFGELYGRRLTYLSGVGVFTAGSLVAFLADSAGVLVAAQAVMGVGAAAILPSGLAIVSTSFQDPQERTGAISIWASCAGLGLAIGPLLAGLLLRELSWHSVYLTNVVLGAIAGALALLVLGESKHPSRQLDPLGVVLGTVTVAAATYAVIEGGASGYGQPRIVVAYLVTAVAGVLFVRVESTHHDPMLDLGLFRSRSFTTVMLVTAAAMFGFVGIALLSVLHLQRVAGHDPLGAGVRLMPMMLSYVVLSAFGARIVRTVGFTVTLTVGLLLMGAGALSLLWNGADSGYAHMWPGLLLTGVGSALLIAPSTAAAVNSVGPLQAGMASATVNLFRQLGSMLGPAVLGTIATSRFPSILAESLDGQGGVSRATADAVATSVSHGQSPKADAGTLALLAKAVPDAFTTALHSGLVVGGLVLLAIAVLAALFVRHQHPVAPSAPLTPERN